MIRPMDSDVTALSSVVAEGHHASQFVSSTLSIIPYGEFSPVRLRLKPPSPRPPYAAFSGCV